jgi:hypothetical protein
MEISKTYRAQSCKCKVNVNNEVIECGSIVHAVARVKHATPAFANFLIFTIQIILQNNHKSEEHAEEEGQRKYHDKKFRRFKSIVVKDIFVNLIEVYHVSNPTFVWIYLVRVKDFFFDSLVVSFDCVQLLLLFDVFHELAWVEKLHYVGHSYDFDHKKDVVAIIFKRDCLKRKQCKQVNVKVGIKVILDDLIPVFDNQSRRFMLVCFHKVDEKVNKKYKFKEVLSIRNWCPVC